VVAVSLNEARRREHARLAALVERIARETGHDPDDRPHRTTIADGRQLRGLPAHSRHADASAIAGTQPGSDAHLDALSR
jgi:hypothetical protein